MNHKRRQFLKNSAITAMSGMLLPTSMMAMTDNAKKIRVLVWDERSKEEK